MNTFIIGMIGFFMLNIYCASTGHQTGTNPGYYFNTPKSGTVIIWVGSILALLIGIGVDIIDARKCLE